MPWLPSLPVSCSQTIKFEEPLYLQKVLAFVGIVAFGCGLIIPAVELMYVLGAVAVSASAASVVALASGLATMVAVVLTNRELLIPDYKSTLKIAIQEAHLQCDKESKELQIPDDPTEAALETLLTEGRLLCTNLNLSCLFYNYSTQIPNSVAQTISVLLKAISANVHIGEISNFQEQKKS